MILTDVNVLVHAYNTDSPRHATARAWWEERLNGRAPVGLTWIAILGFIRLTTSRQVLANPWSALDACAAVRTWLERPVVTIVHPGDRHAEILFGLLASIGTAGNLTTDAHLAAIAIEYQAELFATDADFGRFPGLRWINPLRSR
jgi:toxin-antitoxin system PIN domain toxin